MKCPKCGSNDCQILQEVNTEGQDFSVKKAICCGIFDPFLILCGFCGKGKQTKTSHYWLCNNCGRKWKIK